MADEEWQVAGGRRKRNGGGTTRPGRPPGIHAAAVAPIKPAMPPTERQVARCCAQLDDAAAELAAAPFWAHLTQQLQDALPSHCSVPHLTHMVIYGLGSLEQPGATHIRYQLAAAKLLAALLPLAAAAEAFDPVFTDLDRAALAHCGIQARDGAKLWRGRRGRGGSVIAGGPGPHSSVLTRNQAPRCAHPSTRMPTIIIPARHVLMPATCRSSN